MRVFETWMNYIELYPDEDEEGFDGVHYGGIKCLSADAPEKEKEAYQRYLKEEAEAKKQGVRLW